MEKKEAMKILKDFHDKSALFSVRTALHTIIPELNKSEDNMIKEELIKHLKDGVEGYMPAGDSEDYARWLAWLEKQGDQKSVDKEYTFKSIPRLLDMIEPTDRAKSYCKKLIDSLQTEGYSVDAKIVGECLKQMNGEKVAMAVMDTEKQDEQKPQRMVSAEAKEALYDKPTWSEEDERICQCLIQDQEEALEDVRNDKYGHSEIISDLKEMYRERIDWLESLLRNRIKPRPDMVETLRTEYEKGRADTIAEMKSCWSEEDEKKIDSIIETIRIRKFEHPQLVPVYDGDIDWLKSLKDRVIPQPKQEWSEEDEYTLNETIQHLEELIRIDKTKHCACDVQYYQRDIDWLKSLRPQNNITDEELAQAKKDAYNDALDKIEYHSGEPTFDDGWSAAIWYLKKKNAMPQTQWKPSEEQLNNILDVLSFDNCTPKRRELLESLYEQLKKLLL